MLLTWSSAGSLTAIALDQSALGLKEKVDTVGKLIRCGCQLITMLMVFTILSGAAHAYVLTCSGEDGIALQTLKRAEVGNKLVWVVEASRPISWNESVRLASTCKYTGNPKKPAYLASLPTGAEYSAVTSQFTDADLFRCWLNAGRGYDGYWYWFTPKGNVRFGRDMKPFWAPDEPNNSGYNETVLAIWFYGKRFSDVSPNTKNITKLLVQISL